MSENEHRYTILIVDDTPENIEILSKLLRPTYNIEVATTAEMALEIVRSTNHPDLILLDILMPDTNGYEVCTFLKADPSTRHIPVIFITALADSTSEAKGLALGAVDYIYKPFRPHLVKARVHNHVELKRHQDDLEVLVRERTEELELSKDATLVAMASLAEYRDPETGAHILRTQNYVRAIAESLSAHPRFSHYLDPVTIDLFYKSAPLHDIGKVAIPDSILLKPGKLTDSEFKKMKQHTVYGYEALKRAGAMLGEDSFLMAASQIIITHHEKWDGSGYPYGLKGEDIPLAGRIMALADVYDALICKRVYKPAFSHKNAIQIISDDVGVHFDPDVFEAFMSNEGKIMEIATTYKDLA